jgi:hypothetical protein
MRAWAAVASAVLCAILLPGADALECPAVLPKRDCAVWLKIREHNTGKRHIVSTSSAPTRVPLLTAPTHATAAAGMNVSTPVCGMVMISGLHDRETAAEHLGQ